MGSSRDWAAKGTALLGVKCVIAESYERIHRSNLLGMGVLPLQFKPGQNLEKLGLNGHELYSVMIDDTLKPGQDVPVEIVMSEVDKKEILVQCRLDTQIEMEYYRNGGILQTVLRKFIKNNQKG